MSQTQLLDLMDVLYLSTLALQLIIFELLLLITEHPYVHLSLQLRYSLITSQYFLIDIREQRYDTLGFHLILCKIYQYLLLRTHHFLHFLLLIYLCILHQQIELLRIFHLDRYRFVSIHHRLPE